MYPVIASPQYRARGAGTAGAVPGRGVGAGGRSPTGRTLARPGAPQALAWTEDTDGGLPDPAPSIQGQGYAVHWELLPPSLPPSPGADVEC
jgi:hypothetical protein